MTYGFNGEDLNKTIGIEETVGSLDELFRRSKQLRSSEKFLELLDFTAKFRNYSTYNNALVYLQNPNVTYYATASHWRKEFERWVKADARPMVILAPMTPVLMVYDLADTEGPALPKYLIDPFLAKGSIDKRVMTNTIENCRRDMIDVSWTKKSFLNAGCAIRYFFRENVANEHSSKVSIEINNKLNETASYATITHEIAHIYLGHLGTDNDQWWPDRRHLTRNQKELEAEAASYIVCSRVGLETKSDEYLSLYLKSENDLEAISVESIIKTAALVERMGTRRLPPRKKKTMR